MKEKKITSQLSDEAIHQIFGIIESEIKIDGTDELIIKLGTASERLKDWVHHADPEIHSKFMDDIESVVHKAEAWDILYNETSEPTDLSEEWKQEDWELYERMDSIEKYVLLKK